MPRLGFVYETRLPGAILLVCVCIRRIPVLRDFCYDFLVLDGDKPGIRTWSGSMVSTFPMGLIMQKYGFTRVA